MSERIFRLSPGTVCRYEIEERVPLLFFWTRWKYRGQSDDYQTLVKAAEICGRLETPIQPLKGE